MFTFSLYHEWYQPILLLQFAQRLTINLPMRRDEMGFYTPEVQYMIIDILIRYNHDKLVAPRDFTRDFTCVQRFKHWHIL